MNFATANPRGSSYLYLFLLPYILSAFAMEHGPPPPPPLAPSLPLPQAHFYSVEYPGYVSTKGIPRAVQTLDARGLDNAFRRNVDALELRLRPEDPFAHPLRGEVRQTSALLMRVVKRKRKDGRGGEYTTEVVGSVARTARFRGLRASFCAARHLTRVLRSDGRLPVLARPEGSHRAASTLAGRHGWFAPPPVSVSCSLRPEILRMQLRRSRHSASSPIRSARLR